MTYDAPKTNRPLIHILNLFNTLFYNIKAVARVVVAKDPSRGPYPIILNRLYIIIRTIVSSKVSSNVHLNLCIKHARAV